MSLTVHIISDSTGDTAATLARAVGVQFTDEEIFLRRHTNVRTTELVDRAINHATREKGFVIYSMVSRELCVYVESCCQAQGLICIDLLGPLLNAFSNHFGREAIRKPGAFHAVNKAYFDKIAAIEFTLRHDDNMNMNSIEQADLVIVGVSRTSKTPVSMYLGMQYGLKVANVALAKGLDPPPILTTIAPQKVVGLTIQPERLVEIRRSRLDKIQREKKVNYADENFVLQELEMSQRYFKKHPRWPVIDVSFKSIEETATLILDKVFGRLRPMELGR